MGVLYPPWKTELIELINERNSSRLDNGDVTLTLSPTSGANRAVMEVTPANLLYQGSQTVHYTRRNIANAFLGIPVVLLFDDEVITYRDIIEALIDQYGLSLDLNLDFNTASLSAIVDLSNGATQTVHLVFADTSPCWRGVLPVAVANRYASTTASWFVGAATYRHQRFAILPG